MAKASGTFEATLHMIQRLTFEITVSYVPHAGDPKVVSSSLTPSIFGGVEVNRSNVDGILRVARGSNLFE